MPSTDVHPGRSRGSCPGVRTVFEAADGGLVRVRVPGGRLTAAAALALADAAERHGSGRLELTSRANLQLRGIATSRAEALAADLVAAGLALPDATADERRNVLASPTAGLDLGELADTGPLVEQAATALAALAPDAPVSHKFGVLVDAGGRVNLRGRRHALGLAVVADGERLRLAVHLGTPLPVDPTASPGPTAVADLEQLDDLVAGAAVLGDGATPAALGAALGRPLERRPAAELGWGAPAGPSGPPLGVLPNRSPGRAAVGAAPLLGRLDAADLRALATVVGGEVRLTPWRTVLLPDVPAAGAPAVLAALAGLGLAVDPDDPAVGVVACAGSSGCSSGLADTQADAADLVARLRARPRAAGRAPTVHLSGCPKGCAAGATAAEVTLVAGPRPGTYQGVPAVEAIEQLAP